jgi:hypothetical protein
MGGRRHRSRAVGLGKPGAMACSGRRDRRRRPSMSRVPHVPIGQPDHAALRIPRPPQPRQTVSVERLGEPSAALATMVSPSQPSHRPGRTGALTQSPGMSTRAKIISWVRGRGGGLLDRWPSALGGRAVRRSRHVQALTCAQGRSS